MVYGARRGTRVYAPDGSAFFKCVVCHRSIAVALYDMHKLECRLNRKHRLHNKEDDRRRKRVRRDVGVEQQQPRSPILISDDDAKGTRSPPRPDGLAIVGKPNPPFGFGAGVQWVDVDRMPRSAFRIFMESYEMECGLDDWFEIDRTGFEKWRSMTAEERKPFEDKAREVDLAYLQGLESEELRWDISISDSECSSSLNEAYEYKNPYYW